MYKRQLKEGRGDYNRAFVGEVIQAVAAEMAPVCEVGAEDEVMGRQSRYHTRLQQRLADEAVKVRGRPKARTRDRDALRAVEKIVVRPREKQHFRGQREVHGERAFGERGWETLRRASFVERGVRRRAGADADVRLGLLLDKGELQPSYITVPLKKVPVRVAKYDVPLREAALRAVQAMHAILSSMVLFTCCLLYTSPSPRDYAASRMPSSA